MTGASGEGSRAARFRAVPTQPSATSMAGNAAATGDAARLSAPTAVSRRSSQTFSDQIDGRVSVTNDASGVAAWRETESDVRAAGLRARLAHRQRHSVHGEHRRGYARSRRG